MPLHRDRRPSQFSRPRQAAEAATGSFADTCPRSLGALVRARALQAAREAAKTKHARSELAENTSETSRTAPAGKMIDAGTPEGKMKSEFLLRRYGTNAAIRISTRPPMEFRIEKAIPDTPSARSPREEEPPPMNSGRMGGPPMLRPASVTPPAPFSGEWTFPSTPHRLPPCQERRPRDFSIAPPRPTYRRSSPSPAFRRWR